MNMARSRGKKKSSARMKAQSAPPRRGSTEITVRKCRFEDAGERAVNLGGSTGLAFGFSPLPRLTVWTQGDVNFRSGEFKDHAYTALLHASYEVVRGLWLEVTPQLETSYGDSSGGLRRLGVGLNWLPRTHWNVIVNYYDDKDRQSDFKAKTLLLQLHLYL